MCGCFCVVRNREGQDLVDETLTGLYKLEYRGFDSCGLGWYDNISKSIKTEKSLSLDSLKLIYRDSWDLQHTSKQSANIVLGHNRWASSSKPNISEAHPILGGSNHDSIALVHNGTIENYKELKKELKLQGFEFKTETDTEVIAHVAAIYCNKNLKLQPKDIIPLINKKLKGTWAYAFICKNLPNHLFASTQGIPLYYTESGMVSSDIESLRGTDEYYNSMEDGDYLIIEYCELLGKVIKPKIAQYNSIGNVVCRQYKFTKQVTVPGTFNFNCKDEEVVLTPIKQDFMLKEIEEQATILLDWTWDGGYYKWDLFKPFNSLENIVLFGCGTSLNACILARKYFQDIAGIQSFAECASEFNFPLNYHKNSLYICATQSGETADCIDCLNNLKGNNILTFTNVITGKASKLSTKTVNIKAGPEMAVPSTKAFTLTCLSLYHQAEDLKLQESDDMSWHSKAFKIGKAIKSVILQQDKIKKISEELCDYDYLLFLARDYNYPIAREIALKFKETTYKYADCAISSEVKHGILPIVSNKMMSVFITGNEEDKASRIYTNMSQIKSRNGKILTIAAKNTKETGYNHYSDLLIEVDTIGNKYLDPLILNVVGQLLSYYSAKYLGLDTDKPRSLAKSVTIY